MQNSEIARNRNLTRLKAAEIIIPRKTVITKCEDEIVMKLASYMVAVFDSSKYSHDHIGKYLNRSIPPKYVHDNGNRKAYELYEDYTAYYHSLEAEDLMSINTMSRILRGHRCTFGNICQLGLFFGIEPSDLLIKGDEGQRMDVLIEQMAQEQCVDEKLKASDQMKWVRAINIIRASAEETVCNEMIYI